ncbi:MAG: GNAT family N-acetyltransferase [Candidatus Lokiarchaeota archaeon]|nr:GNAT family N-acetyltransferase [Candidatus Lokiarchaeota archaeon]
MNIRKASEKDIPNLIQIIIEYKKEQNILFEINQIEELRRTLVNSIKNEENTLIVSIDSESHIVDGFINFHILDFPLILGKELYISDLLIQRNSRGKGKGTLLLKYIEDIAYNQGCIRIMLNNRMDSEGYIRDFYKKNGFFERNNIANFVKHL